MRVFSEETEPYLQALAACVSKDPASLEYWRCLYIPGSEHLEFEDYESVLRDLKDALKEVDCDMVHCADNDLFVISRALSSAQMYEIADMLIDTLARQGQASATVRLYNMFAEWRPLLELLLAKTGSAAAPHWIPLVEAAAEDHAALQEVFIQAKAQRKNRLPLNVMLVEDDPLTRRLVAVGFKEKYALITATNAKDAVENYLLHAPDIVFLDIGLPDKSGFAVLQQIMANDPEAYIVMFSGNSYLDNINKAFGAGASGFIAKPFHKEKLQHYIEDSALHHHKYAV